MNFSTGAYLVDVNYRGGYRSLGGIFDIGPGNSTDPADYTLVVTNVSRGGADRSALFTVTSFFQNPTLISGNPGNNVVVFQLTTTIPNTDPLIIQEWYPGYTLTVTDTTGGGAVNVVSTNFDILARMSSISMWMILDLMSGSLSTKLELTTRVLSLQQLWLLMGRLDSVWLRII